MNSWLELFKSNRQMDERKADCYLVQIIWFLIEIVVGVVITTLLGLVIFGANI